MQSTTFDRQRLCLVAILAHILLLSAAALHLYCEATVPPVAHEAEAVDDAPPVGRAPAHVDEHGDDVIFWALLFHVLGYFVLLLLSLMELVARPDRAKGLEHAAVRRSTRD